MEQQDIQRHDETSPFVDNQIVGFSCNTAFLLAFERIVKIVQALRTVGKSIIARQISKAMKVKLLIIQQPYSRIVNKPRYLIQDEFCANCFSCSCSSYDQKVDKLCKCLFIGCNKVRQKQNGNR